MQLSFPRVSSLARTSACAFLSLVITTAGVRAQDEPPKDRQSVGLPEYNVIDKLLATEALLGPSLGWTTEDAWAGEYRRLYKRFQQDINPLLAQKRSRPAQVLALGVKGSDGVLALKGRDIQALNQCAEQIEKLAHKLDVPDSLLQRANIVKHHGNQQHWVEAFMELGFLQHQIMSSFENNPAQKDDAVLVILGAWAQAGQCVTGLILDHYTPQTSNLLREPKLIKMMIQEVDKLNPAYKQDATVQELIKFLPVVYKVVDVPLRAPVPQDQVQSLHQGFTRLVQLAVSPESAAAKP